MILRQFFHDETSTYTYLLACEETSKAVIIDPVLDTCPFYLSVLKELDVTLLYAIDTHIHADHISALGELRDITSCATIMGEFSQAHCVTQKVKDDEIIDIGKVKLKAFYTPGHTNESFSFTVDNKVFTGDTLLIGGSGRTDFQGGDAGESWDSIQSKLFTLPDDTIIYPGHDYNGRTSSTVGEEKTFNPRLAGKQREEYIEIMDGLVLTDPALMDIAVPMNLQCGKQP